MADLIPFVDVHGNVIRLPGDMTIEQAVERGIKFRVVPAEEPLEPGWFRDQWKPEVPHG